MGLFSDDEEGRQEHDDAPDEEEMTEENASELEDADVENVSGPDANGNGGAGDENTQDLEKALKDLAARMTVVQSNVESVKDARGDLENKLEEMESRMHRLGGLAEAVSSQYNPFLSENEPGEPSWQGDQPHEEPAESDDEELTPVAPEPDTPPADSDEVPPLDVGGDPSGADEETVVEDEPATTEDALEAPPAQREAEASDLRDAEHLMNDVRDIADRREQARQRPKELKERLLLLEWVGLMMRRVGRAGLMDLMEYYEGLGWLDPRTKNKALRVAVGIEAPDRVGEGGWRGDLDLHERSLMAIERLQGDEITQAELEELQMDMQRLFER